MYNAIIKFDERISKNGTPYTCLVAVIDNGSKNVEVVLGYHELAKKVALELLK